MRGSSAPPSRVGRVRTTRSKLEELPTVLERTQGQEQRLERGAASLGVDDWTRTPRSFCEERRRGGNVAFQCEDPDDENLSDSDWDNLFPFLRTGGGKRVESATYFAAM